MTSCKLVHLKNTLRPTVLRNFVSFSTSDNHVCKPCFLRTLHSQKPFDGQLGLLTGSLSSFCDANRSQCYRGRITGCWFAVQKITRHFIDSVSCIAKLNRKSWFGTNATKITSSNSVTGNCLIRTYHSLLKAEGCHCSVQRSQFHSSRHDTTEYNEIERDVDDVKTADTKSDASTKTSAHKHSPEFLAESRYDVASNSESAERLTEGKTGVVDSAHKDLAESMDVTSDSELAKWVTQVKNNVVETPSPVVLSDEVGHDQGEVTRTHQPPVPILMESYNLAPYVAKSEVLRLFVKLGVNLAKVEAKKDAASILVKLDLKQDVIPILHFLKDNGVPDDQLGNVISKNPYIFSEELENLKIRIGYFQSKKFAKDAIVRIITNSPRALSLQVHTVDKRLGMYQNYFQLTGNQVRDVVTRVPRLLCHDPVRLGETIKMLTEYFEFTKPQLKQIILHCPMVFSAPNLKARLDYLMTGIPMDHKTITKFAHILTYRTFIIKTRHLYLLELGRAQYDPSKENYVSPTDLVCTPEDVFLCNVARTDNDTYKRFKKTM